MPLCERSTSTIQAVADAFLTAPPHANRNTHCGCMGNSAHWRLVTNSDNSLVARHAISADMAGNLVEVATASAAPVRSVLRAPNIRPG
jgi:hypothetical protein